MSEVEQSGIPQTMEELKAFADENHIPLDKLHMHLGKDYPGPKAFGIYQDGPDFVVYKNKADGSRAVRYRGTDEAHAVSEIYQKMREMGLTAKAAKAAGSSYESGEALLRGDSGWTGTPKSRKKNPSRSILGWIVAIFLVAAGLSAYFEKNEQKYERGYYHYHDDYYYSDGYDWYRYDDGLWYSVGIGLVEGIVENYGDYAVNVYEEGIEPYVSYSSDYDGYDNDYDDDDDYDWYDDNDWDYDYDNDWDWDSDW